MHWLLAAGFMGAVALPSAVPAADLVRVGTPEGTSLPFNLLDVASQSGAFAKYGIEIERQDLAGSAKLHPAMASGVLDVAMGSGSDFLFIVKGVPEIAVGVFQKLPNDLVILSRPDGPAKLSDLKGTKMGVAGPGGLTLWVGMSAVRNEGFEPKAVTYAYLGGNAVDHRRPVVEECRQRGGRHRRGLSGRDRGQGAGIGAGWRCRASVHRPSGVRDVGHGGDQAGRAAALSEGAV